MKLTAHQRDDARFALWAIPISVVLGAAFGHFYSANDSVWEYIKGGVAGILISTTIVVLELVVFSRTRRFNRRLPFLLYLALRTLGYLVAIVLGLAKRVALAELR